MTTQPQPSDAAKIRDAIKFMRSKACREVRFYGGGVALVLTKKQGIKVLRDYLDEFEPENEYGEYVRVCTIDDWVSIDASGSVYA